MKYPVLMPSKTGIIDKRVIDGIKIQTIGTFIVMEINAIPEYVARNKLYEIALTINSDIFYMMDDDIILLDKNNLAEMKNLLLSNDNLGAVSICKSEKSYRQAPRHIDCGCHVFRKNLLPLSLKDVFGCCCRPWANAVKEKNLDVVFLDNKKRMDHIIRE